MTRTRTVSHMSRSIIRWWPPSVAKRLLLLPLLGANAAFAQYCEIDFTNGIEPITRVQFADIDNAVVGSGALEDFTSVSTPVLPGETYALVLEGDTAGNFVNYFSVFIDWNQDYEFDGPNESHELDDPLENSTGSDGQQATADIVVPAGALPGTIRMRVVKNYASHGSACGEHDYGQAEDYSLLVGEPSGTEPVVTSAIPPQNTLVNAAFFLDLSNHVEDRSADNSLTFSATGLPTGVTLDADTGDIGGNPAGLGTYRIAVRATNSGGEFVSTNFNLRVEPEHEDFAGGDGTEEDPWQVASAAQLYAIRHDLYAHYVLVDDIELGTAPWNVDAGWLPIGDESDPFMGSLDGSGYRVTGLYIDKPAINEVGLFGSTWYANIGDVHLENVSVGGHDYVGALVGNAGASNISGSSVTGTIRSGEQGNAEYAGGLIGYAAYDTVISGSDADVSVAGDSYVGGLVGGLELDGIIATSHAIGSVTGSDYAVGGLVGGTYEAEVADSHAHADVVAEMYGGGLIGVASNSSIIRRSHAVGSVTVNDRTAGGLLGLLSYAGELYDSYAHASVSGGEYVGGLLGETYGGRVFNSYAVGSVSGFTRGGLVGGVYSPGEYPVEIRDSYWSTDHAPGLSACGDNENDGSTSLFVNLEGLSQSEMQQDSVFVAAGWNFDAIWAIAPGSYPYHVLFGAENGSSPAPPIPDQLTLVNAAFSLDVSVAFHDADHALLGYAATGLPSGMDISDNGVISGTPATSGHYVVTITATYDGTGPRTGSVAIDILDFAGGAGSGADPWQVSTAEQLDALRNFLAAHFVLTADIDLGGEDGPFANGGAGWAPIGGGTLGDPFTGSFDGGGHVISGLFIDRPDVDHAGLFGTIDNADIRNVGVVDVNVAGDYAVGALVAYQAGGSITNSFVTGNVSGVDNVGGLVGISEEGLVTNSYSRASVTSDSGATGGLVGTQMWGEISASYASGTISSPDGFTGGILGGNIQGVLDGSFWNTDRASRGVGCNVSGGGCDPDPGTIAGLSTADMRLQASYTGWDFADTWTIHPLVNDGYPYLQWQNVVVPNSPPNLVSAIGNQDATQGSAFTLDVSTHFVDADDDALSFTASGLPTSLTLSDGVISGTPTNADALNAPHAITVTAFDGTASISDSFQLNILNVNDTPVLVSAIGNHTGTESSAFSLNVASHFSDPDGDALTFSATGLPTGLSMDATGLISGMPSVAGASTVTVTAADPGLDSASGNFTLTIDALPPEPEDPEPQQPGTTVIDTSKSGETLSGNIVITENGVLDGGKIDGSIDNRGTITGDVQLAGGARIDGGTVSGSVSGDAAQPAVITNADIPAGTRLDNVVIGAGTTLDAGVQIGANVRFESDAAIPAAIDLTGALRQLLWAGKDARPVPDLDDDVVTDAALSLIRSIQLLPEFELTDSEVSQDAGNGEIVVITSDTRSTVLPVQVSQANADEGEGVYVNDDGDVVFVTGNRRAVLSYPVLVASEALVDALRSLGLELSYDDRANLQVAPATTGAQTLLQREGYALRASALVNAGFYYSSRPALEALPAHRFSAPGLYYHTVPGLPNATSLVLVFEDEAGKLLEQELVPVPADWFALKGYLEQLPGARNVRIDAQGIVSVTLNGATIRGRVGYDVGTGAADTTAGLVLKSTGDINGDRTGDYLLHYPNGDVQHLLIYP